MELNDKQIKLSDFLTMIEGLSKEEYELLLNRLKDEGIEVIDDDYELSISDDIYEDYIKSIINYPKLTKIEEQELFKKYKNGDKKARERLINCNLKLVVWVARRNMNYYCGNVIDIMDLIQEGNKGLMIAIDKFDVDLGYKFSSYATWWIRQAITRYKLNTKDTIRKPVYLGELEKKYDRFILEFEKSNSRKPTDLEILASLEVTQEQLKYIIDSKKTIISMNSPVRVEEKESDTTIIDMIVVENKDLEELEGNMFVNQFVKKLVESNILNDNQLFVFLSRVGIEYNNIGSPYPLTLDAIGKKIGLTRERIRQIEIKALKIIKQNKKLFFDKEECKQLIINN